MQKTFLQQLDYLFRILLREIKRCTEAPIKRVRKVNYIFFITSERYAVSLAIFDGAMFLKSYYGHDERVAILMK